MTLSTNYQINSTTKATGSLTLDLDIEGWIIVGKFKNEDRCFKISSVYMSFDLHDDSTNPSKHDTPVTIEPELRMAGNWCDSTGRKWQSRQNWWYSGYQDTPNFHFGNIPQQVKILIYEKVEEALRNHVVKLTGDYKILTANKGFAARPITTNQEDSDGVFLSTVHNVGTSVSSPFEGHDVSRWAIARKELGLPKPKRKRKPKP